MSEIKHSRNIITIMNEIKEKNEEKENENSIQKNKERKKSHDFLFFPMMDIDKKFKLNNAFDRRHSKEFLEEKDKYLETVELDDRLPEEIGETPLYKTSKIDLLNITFGR